jgi:CRP/FNR family transcriptional regulator, cyclic AMP receptor protein
MSSSTDQEQHVSEYEVNLEMLAEVPMFSGFPIAALKVLAYLCKRETIKEGEYLFRRGDADRQAYRIIEGTALLLLEQNGCEQPLRPLREEEFIGGLSLLSDMDRLFSAKAESKLTCLVVTGETIDKIVAQFPDVAVKMTEALIEAVHGWERKFVHEHLAHCAECRSFVGVTLL